MNYYNRYPGDYQRDTGHLSLTEHGAYTVLMDHYYSTRRPLPAESTKLHRLCRATQKFEQQAVDAVVDEFFPLTDDGFRHNPRCDAEICKWEGRAEHNRTIGKLGGRPKAKPSDNPDGVPRDNPGDNPNTNPNHKPGESRGEPSPSPTPAPTPTPEPTPTPLRTDTYARDPAKAREDFLQFREAYPPGNFPDSEWQLGERDYYRALDAGETAAAILGGAIAYREQQRAIGKLRTQFIRSPRRFLEAGFWRGPFDVPAGKAEQRQAENVAAIGEFVREGRA